MTPDALDARAASAVKSSGMVSAKRLASGTIMASNPAWPVFFNSMAVVDPPLADTRLLEPPELPTRKSTEALIGYRGWDVDEVGGTLVLRSVFAQHTWGSAALRSDKPPAPYDPHFSGWRGRDDHGYGIYAYKDPDTLMSCGFSEWDAFGRVRLTGRVVVHERGYRAEVAVIDRLVLHPTVAGEFENAAGRLSDLYQCEVSYDFGRILEV